VVVVAAEVGFERRPKNQRRRKVFLKKSQDGPMGKNERFENVMIAVVAREGLIGKKQLKQKECV